MKSVSHLPQPRSRSSFWERGWLFRSSPYHVCYDSRPCNKEPMFTWPPLSLPHLFEHVYWWPLVKRSERDSEHNAATVSLARKRLWKKISRRSNTETILLRMTIYLFTLFDRFRLSFQSFIISKPDVPQRFYPRYKKTSQSSSGRQKPLSWQNSETTCLPKFNHTSLSTRKVLASCWWVFLSTTLLSAGTEPSLFVWVALSQQDAEGFGVDLTSDWLTQPTRAM